MKKQSDNGKLVTGLLIGAAVGAVLGLLLAPGKGRDTRKKVADGAGDLAEDLLRKFRNATGQDGPSGGDGKQV